MNNQSRKLDAKSKIVVVGAGPSGTSLSIRLARSGFRVTLIERDRFPRQKLCGEFVSPECLEHFRELGVLDAMLDVGGDRISVTRFFSPAGRSVSVPSVWFGNESHALSVSRAAMDQLLLDRARDAGVSVLEETQVVGLELDHRTVHSVRVKSGDASRFDIAGDLFIDATGRPNHLAKLVSKLQNPSKRPKVQNRLVGFKAHLENVRLEPGVCEIYFYEGGYGGLSYVENGNANHCFLVTADRFKESGSVQKLIETVVFKNKRAFETMSDANPVFDWLAVSMDGFGRKDLQLASNLFAVGDAAAFIDPFTGSGMLMAFEGAEILAGVIRTQSVADLGARYSAEYSARFARRLRVCGFLRRAAFLPNAASAVIAALGLSQQAVKHLARATRGHSPRFVK